MKDSPLSQKVLFANFTWSRPTGNEYLTPIRLLTGATEWENSSTAWLLHLAWIYCNTHWASKCMPWLAGERENQHDLLEKGSLFPKTLKCFTCECLLRHIYKTCGIFTAGSKGLCLWWTLCCACLHSSSDSRTQCGPELCWTSIHNIQAVTSAYMYVCTCVRRTYLDIHCNGVSTEEVPVLCPCFQRLWNGNTNCCLLLPALLLFHVMWGCGLREGHSP